MNAYNDLLEYLEDGEVPQFIVFGAYGWNGHNEPGCEYDEYDSDEDRAQNNPPVPYDKRGVVLPFDEKVIEYMDGWEFYGGYGSPSCYAVYIWTNTRVIWVTQYDGSTSLSSAPRNPIDLIPDMPGG